MLDYYPNACWVNRVWPHRSGSLLINTNSRIYFPTYSYVWVHKNKVTIFSYRCKKESLLKQHLSAEYKFVSSTLTRDVSTDVLLLYFFHKIATN